MILAKVRYKGVSWVHNPKTLKINKENGLKESQLPFAGSVLQDLGSKAKIISGTGKLFGEDCILQYQKLQELQSQPGSGILSLPDMKPFYAFFKTIELACDPTPQVVTYNFVFVEDVSKHKTDNTHVYHYVSDEEETLWDISYKFGKDMNTLVSLNPWLKRIDELKAGDRVRIC